MEVDFDDKRVRKGGVFDSNDKFDLTISWDNDKKKLYTLVFFDLDAPYPDESDIPYIHYLVINVPGDNIEKGKTVLEYKPTIPPKDSSPHEYIVQLYEQPTKINVGKVERRSNLDELLPSDLIL